jgi:hypothetical protein
LSDKKSAIGNRNIAFSTVRLESSSAQLGREGALFALERLTVDVGRLFEPFIVLLVSMNAILLFSNVDDAVRC